MKLVVVGLTGGAGTGKDTIGESLIVNRGFRRVSFADPLYRISKLEVAKQNGDLAAPYEMFKLVLDLMGGPGIAPPIEVVVDIATNQMTAIAEKTGLIRDIENGTKPREFLQFVGTDFFRAYDENIWADYFIKSVIADVVRVREDYFTALEIGETMLRASGEDVAAHEGTAIPEPKMRLVITDLRFDNEAIALERLVDRATELGNDVFASSMVLKLHLPVEEGARRVSQRDDIPYERVMERMGHASEAGVDESLVDTIIDASKPAEEVWLSVRDALDGLKSVPSSVIEFIPGEKGHTNIVDLSQYAPRTKE